MFGDLLNQDPKDMMKKMTDMMGPQAPSKTQEHMNESGLGAEKDDEEEEYEGEEEEEDETTSETGSIDTPSIPSDNATADSVASDASTVASVSDIPKEKTKKKSKK